MFTPIGAENFNSEALAEEKPVLLAFISPDYEFKEQTTVLTGLSKKYEKKLKVYLLDEDAIGTCMKFGVEGFPAFIIFERGEEKGRMLGKANRETLSSFVQKTLPDIKRRKRNDESTGN